jgi:protein KTI12
MISGYPASGKTHRSEQLKSFFHSQIESATDPAHKRLTVVHISDDTLGVPRSVYDAARTEKDARGTLSSAVKRALSRDCIVICDAMNYIKGFRYQMHCEAKAVQTTSCVVHVGTPIDKCREINEQRLAAAAAVGTAATTTSSSSSQATAAASTPASDSAPLPTSPEPSTAHSSSTATPPAHTSSPALPYPAELFDNLVFRYEEPNGMTRWDSPLFTIPFSDPSPPCAAIWDSLIGSAGARKLVKPNMATVAPAHQSANALQHMEHTTSTIVAAIQATLADNPEASDVAIAGVEERVLLPAMQRVSLPQLQRLRRQFLQMQRSQFGKLGGDGKGLAESRVGQAFVGFLNGSFGTDGGG